MEGKSEEEVIRENIKLVYKVIHKHIKKYRVELEDLTQVGIIGLIKAHRRFNSSKGTSFSTYAYRLIEGEILHYILQDRHHFKTYMVNGEYHREEVHHYDFDNLYKKAGYSFNYNYLTMDLKRILEKEEFFIIKKYYYEKATTKEISEVLQYSECWVNKLRNKALSKIKKNLVVDL